MAGTKSDAEAFAKRWANRGDETQEGRSYWMNLFQNVLGVEDAIERLKFEVPLRTDSGSSHAGYIDVLIPSASVYDFGILMSQFHNAWMRMVAGRLKSDYSCANTIVYNNFVWPEPSETQRAEVERCAQAVLDARSSYEGLTLVDMYNPDNDFLCPVLMRAHCELDAAVEAAYGVNFDGDEEKIVAHLFKLYAERTGE